MHRQKLLQKAQQSGFDEGKEEGVICIFANVQMIFETPLREQRGFLLVLDRFVITIDVYERAFRECIKGI